MPPKPVLLATYDMQGVLSTEVPEDWEVGWGPSDDPISDADTLQELPHDEALAEVAQSTVPRLPAWWPPRLPPFSIGVPQTMSPPMSPPPETKICKEEEASDAEVGLAAVGLAASSAATTTKAPPRSNKRKPHPKSLPKACSLVTGKPKSSGVKKKKKKKPSRG